MLKILAIAVLGVLSAAGTPTGPSAEPASARFVTYNIRYGSAKDGKDAWELRRPKVVQTIAELDADVVGVQEAEASQVRELLAALPRYAALGVHRDDGRTRGESSPILFDRARFTVADSGTFWLSDTPDVIGSVTWDNAITRVCTFARLVDLTTGRGVWVWNAHFDHRGQQSRVASARLVLARMRECLARPGRADPVVLLGDLNAAEDNAVIAVLTGREGEGDGEGERSGEFVLVDSYRRLHPQGAAGTFTAFAPDSDGGAHKIDYVFAGPGLTPRAAGIERRQFDGRYPSDHFPVWAELAWD